MRRLHRSVTRVVSPRRPQDIPNGSTNMNDTSRKVICNLRIDSEIKAAAMKAAKADRRTLTSLIENLLEDHCRRTGHISQSAQQ